MATLSELDSSHARLQLGSHEVTLDIPRAIRGGYDPQEQVEAPNVELELDWVYGYRGRDCRNNLLFLRRSNELVYFAAGVVVLFDLQHRRQRHYLEHNDDIRCIAVHPDGQVIASGQVAGHHKREGKPHVRIWNSENLETLHVLGIGEFQRAVCCVAFSVVDGGDKICVVDEADDHILSVWDWRNDRQIAEARSSKEPVLDLEFHPKESNSIVSCGKGQITFWSINSSRQLESKRGSFKDRNQPKYILCLAFSPKGDLLCGDSNGTIFIWGKGQPKITRAIIDAHGEDSVFSIKFLPDGRMISGGQGGQVKLWDSEYKRSIGHLQVDDFYGPVRCVTGADYTDGVGVSAPIQIFVGTTKNCLLEGSFQHGLVPLVQGHRDEIWAADFHRQEAQFLTAGYDKRVFLWDVESHRPVWRTQLRQPPHSVAISPDGTLVVIGTQTGHWYLLSGNSGEEIGSDRISREQIQCVAMSPLNSHVALGSRDNTIYIFEISGNEMKRIGKLTGHTSYVTHIDWSQDGQYLRSNSGDYEILYWKIPSCDREFSDEVIEDLFWSTHSCTLTFKVAGIWQDANDGTDVNAVCVDSNQTLVASADDFGKVNVYQYPCTSFRAKAVVGQGHSSHVTNVQFIRHSDFLISCGGRDMSIFQWRVKAC